MNLLICNAGSTSLKFKLWRMPEEHSLAEGRVERVGIGNAIFSFRDGKTSIRRDGLDIATYEQGIRMFLEALGGAPYAAVGFKTVLAKGFPGTHFLTNEVLAGMEAFMTVAPAHNGPYLEAIRVFRALDENLPLVGAFETAFHRTIPDFRRRFAIPEDWYRDYGLMRMGYHGASHSYVALRTRGKRRVISCHLGGSSSICAILDGHSMDNSFGLSLQIGMPHNNRVGDLDTFAALYLLRQGVTPDELERRLCTESGLRGVSGTSGDMRDLLEALDAGSERAKLAFDMLTDSIVRYVGSYFLFLGGLDELVFTGGIGERCARLRSEVCARLGAIGARLDEGKNAACDSDGVISAPGSAVTVSVLTANEELMVVRRVYTLLTGGDPDA